MARGAKHVDEAAEAEQRDLAIVAQARLMNATVTFLATEYGRDEDEIEDLLRKHGLTPNRGQAPPPAPSANGTSARVVAPPASPTAAPARATAEETWNATSVEDRIALAERSNDPMHQRNAAIARQALAGATNAELVATTGLSYSSILAICQRFGVTAPQPSRTFGDRSRAAKRGAGATPAGDQGDAAAVTDSSAESCPLHIPSEPPITAQVIPVSAAPHRLGDSLALLRVLDGLLDRLNLLPTACCDGPFFSLLAGLLQDLRSFSADEQRAILQHLAKAKGVVAVE